MERKRRALWDGGGMLDVERGEEGSYRCRGIRGRRGIDGESEGCS